MGFLKTACVVLAVIAVLCLSVVDTNGGCDESTGPGGLTMCLMVSGYETTQWGTCLTKEYVERRSRGRHTCIEENSKYCWYQCMIEMHDKENGTILEDCVCDPNRPSQPNDSLDHTCYSPPGNVCTWYKDCLERKFPCRDSSSTYAVAFAETMCNLYGNRKDDLTSEGALWLDDVRRCLQVDLVPLLRPFESENVTCASLRSHALKTQASCYLEPYDASPSICQLSTSDVWNIFWSVREETGLIFVESLYGLLQVAKSCGHHHLLQLMVSMRKVTVRLDMQELQRSKRAAAIAGVPADKQGLWSRGRREVVNSGTARAAMMNPNVEGARVARQVSNPVWEGESAEELEYHRLAAQATDLLDRRLGWGESDVNVIAFAYGERVEDVLNVHVLLADKHAYDLQDSPYAPRSNMTRIVDQLAEKIEQGEITMTLDGQSAPITYFSWCADIDCRKVFREFSLNSAGGNSGISGTTTDPNGLASRGVGGWMTVLLMAGVVLFLTRSEDMTRQLS